MGDELTVGKVTGDELTEAGDTEDDLTDGDITRGNVSRGDIIGRLTDVSREPQLMTGDVRAVAVGEVVVCVEAIAGVRAARRPWSAWRQRFLSDRRPDLTSAGGDEGSQAGARGSGRFGERGSASSA